MVKCMYCSFRTGVRFPGRMSDSSQPPGSPPAGKLNVTGANPHNYVHNRTIEINLQRTRETPSSLPQPLILKDTGPIIQADDFTAHTQFQGKEALVLPARTSQQKEVCLFSGLWKPGAALTKLPAGSACQILTNQLWLQKGAGGLLEKGVKGASFLFFRISFTNGYGYANMFFKILFLPSKHFWGGMVGGGNDYILN